MYRPRQRTKSNVPFRTCSTTSVTLGLIAPSRTPSRNVNHPVTISAYRDACPVAEYSPHAYRPAIHYPAPGIKAWDLAFSGTAYQSRIEFFERMNLDGLVNFEITDHVKAFGEAWFSETHATNLLAQPAYNTGLFGAGGTVNGNFLLSINNPFLSANDRTLIQNALNAYGATAAGAAGPRDRGRVRRHSSPLAPSLEPVEPERRASGQFADRAD